MDAAALAAVAIALPLACAFAAVPFARRTTLLLWIALPGGLAVAALLCRQVWVQGETVAGIGGWAPPLGIAFRIDGLSAAFVLGAAAITAATALFARERFPDGRTRAGFAFWPLLFAMWASLNALFLGNDLFNLYVALELLTLCAVAMVALEGTAATAAAAVRYMMFSLAGALAYLLGAVLLYAAHGTLDMALLKDATEPGIVAWLAGAAMTAGLMAKMALFPFHAWLPAAHAGAPAPASAMLSALVTKGAFFIALRLWFDVMPAAADPPLLHVLGACGAGAVVVGSVQAYRQERLKLLIAYSTVAQLGYLFLVFALAGGAAAQPWSAGAWSGGVIHALSHAFAKASMFLAAGLVIKAVGDDRIAGLAGLAHHLPLTTFALALAALSIMGLPPSGGFFAKYLMLTAAFASGQWWWAAVIVLGGLMAAAYLFRPFNRALTAPEGAAPAPVALFPQLVVLALAAVSVALGIVSYPTFALLQVGRPGAAVEGL